MAEAEPLSMGRIYLDNAATTWPKPTEAVEASLQFIQDCGAAAGRGAYASAQQADHWLNTARHELSLLLGVANSQDIAFCNSGTHALNAVLRGLLKSGDHVLTTGMEHNSVLRPLVQLRNSSNVHFDVAPADTIGRADPKAARNLVRENTRLLVVGHASNVTGAAHDLRAWADFAKQHQLLYVVDVSQTLGYLPLNINSLEVDALAAAGHKGLGGLQGSGLAYVAEEHQAEFQPLMFGGTGRASEQIDDVPTWPQSIEVGNLNLPAIVSMAVAARQLNRLDTLVAGWSRTFQALVEGLQDISALQLFGQHDFSTQPPDFVPVVSLRVDGWDAHDFASVLDTSFQIEVRAGWHCAALVHDAIGSANDGGTIRLSVGRSTTMPQIDRTLQAFREILG